MSLKKRKTKAQKSMRQMPPLPKERTAEDRLPSSGSAAKRFVKAEESLARPLIWGGHAWAREHRFRVPAGFKTWQGLAGELQEGERREDVVFGEEGQPLLIIGLADLEGFLE